MRPAFTATIGFLRVTRRAIAVNRRGFPNDSRYMRIAWISGLSSQYSRRSLPDTSVLFPIETNIATPRPFSTASARIASPSAPDCETKPTLPRTGVVAAKVALRFTSGSVLTTPMQLGPTMRIRCPRNVALSLASNNAPSDPTSLNPAVMTMSPRTPFLPHAVTTESTWSFATVTIAKSTGPGMSLMFRKQRME